MQDKVRFEAYLSNIKLGEESTLPLKVSELYRKNIEHLPIGKNFWVTIEVE